MMALIEWRDEFATGVADIDYEHQQLIELINSFSTGLKNNSEKAKLIKVLNDIYGEIYSHFMHEESLMEKHGYDQYREHHEDHVNLLDEIRDITDELEATDKLDRQRLQEKLNNWFSNHFKIHDSRLHRLEQLITNGDADYGMIKSFFKKFKANP